MLKYNTADGGHINVTRRDSARLDLAVKNAKGETIATVVMTNDDAYELLTGLDMEF